MCLWVNAEEVLRIEVVRRICMIAACGFVSECAFDLCSVGFSVSNRTVHAARTSLVYGGFIGVCAHASLALEYAVSVNPTPSRSPSYEATRVRHSLAVIDVRTCALFRMTADEHMS